MTTPFDSCLTALRQAGPPEALFKAVDKALAETVGHKLFTLLYVAPDGKRVKRLYTNMPKEYPVGGYKPVTESDWHKLVIGRRRAWVGFTYEDVKWAFFDHELIRSLGCESAINVPVVYAGRVLGTMNLLDAAGRKHTAREWKSARAVALFFIGAECPISNRYAPEINRLVAAYSAQGVAFYGVHSDPDIGPAVALRHAQDYGFDFPVLLDPAQTLAGRTGVILTPTAVILSPAGELLYRGRIDNRYLDFGKYRDAGVKPDLRLALDAVVAGVNVGDEAL